MDIIDHYEIFIHDDEVRAVPFLCEPEPYKCSDRPIFTEQGFIILDLIDDTRVYLNAGKIISIEEKIIYAT